MSPLSRFRFAVAWLPEGWRRNVVIAIDPSGAIASVSADDTATTATTVNGVAIPGMPNVHSHAFQRAMAGRAERASQGREQDNFWTWREAMYDLAGRMTPELLNAIAAQVYVEMLKAGYTSVCEFHYLHRAGSRTPGTEHNPMVMAQALIDAAASSGIGLTLLPTLYQTADFGSATPSERQRQFALATDGFLELVGQLTNLKARTHWEVGIALHSLRAVPPDALAAVVASLPTVSTVHIHVAEQVREVEAAIKYLHARPVEWLLDHAPVDERWCLIHATHATPSELSAIVSRHAVVGLCPTTEANLGDGQFPFSQFLAAGGTFAIGSDSHVSLSPTEELRWLEYEARLETKRRNVCLGEEGSSTGARLWRQACAGGARASGRPIGSLEPARRADIVVLDADMPVLYSRTGDEIIDTFVFAAPATAVRDVMVGGRWLVQEGRHFAETAIAAGYRRAIKVAVNAQ